MRVHNLRELDVPITACAFHETIFTDLMSAMPRITALTISIDPLISLIPAEVYDSDMLASRVSALMRASRILRFSSHNVGTQTPAFPRGPHLPLLSVTVDVNWMQDFFPWLASLNHGNDQNETLQILRLRGIPALASWLNILTTYGPHLRSLSVDWLPGDLNNPNGLRCCTKLERFQINRFPSPEVLSVIPPTIKALAIQGGYDIMASGTHFLPLDSLLQAVESFPSLKVITWNIYKEHPQFHLLEQLCRSRDIEIRTAELVYLNDDDIELDLRRKYLCSDVDAVEQNPSF